MAPSSVISDSSTASNSSTASDSSAFSGFSTDSYLSFASDISTPFLGFNPHAINSNMSPSSKISDFSTTSDISTPFLWLYGYPHAINSNISLSSMISDFSTASDSSTASHSSTKSDTSDVTQILPQFVQKAQNEGLEIFQIAFPASDPNVVRQLFTALDRFKNNTSKYLSEVTGKDLSVLLPALTMIAQEHKPSGRGDSYWTRLIGIPRPEDLAKFCGYLEEGNEAEWTAETYPALSMESPELAYRGTQWLTTVDLSSSDRYQGKFQMPLTGRETLQELLSLQWLVDGLDLKAPFHDQWRLRKAIMSRLKKIQLPTITHLAMTYLSFNEFDKVFVRWAAIRCVESLWLLYPANRFAKLYPDFWEEYYSEVCEMVDELCADPRSKGALTDDLPMEGWSWPYETDAFEAYQDWSKCRWNFRQPATKDLSEEGFMFPGRKGRAK
ncbi:hypothetical protein EJ06DRAFT_519774 [Trichodelitschia bisporula]|uniref:Uncharacterized protein n=1 Tax=Trichodelitschia bisporula TaxID=703511 RepID=A0A6G1I372_9PEZI|nr:hypothetical protein EJ06DRAFT_519774 [Trichodelitschia bisporula]